MVTFGIRFSIKPVKKIRSYNTSIKLIKNMLYCKPKRDEDGNWYAEVNTRGFEGYKDVTILPFSEESFRLKGRTDIFLKEKDNTGHFVHIVRDECQVRNYLNPDIYCSLCENSIFKGHIIKDKDKIVFDIISYVGHIVQYSHLLRKSYSKNEEE